MFQTNVYFDGCVKSIGYENAEGRSTIGVMAKGEYEFGTSSAEEIVVIAGAMHVQLPGSAEWQTVRAYGSFTIPRDSRFRVKVEEDTPYKCIYR